MKLNLWQHSPIDNRISSCNPLYFEFLAAAFGAASNCSSFVAPSRLSRQLELSCFPVRGFVCLVRLTFEGCSAKTQVLSRPFLRHSRFQCVVLCSTVNCKRHSCERKVHAIRISSVCGVDCAGQFLATAETTEILVQKVVVLVQKCPLGLPRRHLIAVLLSTSSSKSFSSLLL